MTQMAGPSDNIVQEFFSGLLLCSWESPEYQMCLVEAVIDLAFNPHLSEKCMQLACDVYLE